MTVLRSREIVPTKATNKSKEKTTPTLTNQKPESEPEPEPKPSCFEANSTPEPATPSKPYEPMDFHAQSQLSSPSYSSHLSPADSGLGAGSVTEQTITPATNRSKIVTTRRSLRLASKSDGVAFEFIREVPVSSKQRKRKRVLGKEDSDAGNADVGLGLVANHAGCVEGELRVEKAKLGLVEESNVDWGVVVPGSGDVHKVFETGSNEGELGSKVEKSVSKSRKRKLSMDSVLSGSDGVVGFLNLRSGKKISKMLIVSDEVDVSDHGKQDENGGDEDDKVLGNEVPLIAKDIGIGKKEKLSVGTRYESKLEGSDYILNVMESNIRLEENLDADAVNSDALKKKNVMQVEDEDKHETHSSDSSSGDDHNFKCLEEGTSRPRSSRRLSREEKGKDVLMGDALPFEIIQEEKVSKINDIGLCSASDVNVLVDTNAPVDKRQDRADHARSTIRDNSRRREFRHIARTNAAQFAYVPREDENELPAEVIPDQEEDWPGPFSTAMKIIKDREKKTTRANLPSSNKGESVHIVWTPKNGEDRVKMKVAVPSLQELCLVVLLKNADAITSLQYVPDVLRHGLSQLLCDSRRMNSHILKLLTQGSPTEIRLRDCSWLTEEEFMESFVNCDTSKLVVLQLDQSGRCMTDYVLSASIAQFSNRLPELATLSITGACHLSDSGLSALTSSASVLRSINLSQCSLLTSASIDILANSLGSSLRELYLDDCQSIDVVLTLPALKKLQYVEVLSVAGIPSVCDDFIKDFISARGKIMKELVLACCEKLTDSSLRVIAEHCPDLHILNLNKLHKLTDSSVQYLANGCQALHTLKLCGNRFSDEAIAAFLETAGASIEELSLNNVQKVGHNTAISLAKCAKKLRSLDLSWCRGLTDNAVGLIIDSCLSLRLLKLFGCSQITNVLINGHSNPQIQIIGLKMSPLLHSLEVPDTGFRR